MGLRAMSPHLANTTPSARANAGTGARRDHGRGWPGHSHGLGTGCTRQATRTRYPRIVVTESLACRVWPRHGLSRWASPFG